MSEFPYNRAFDPDLEEFRLAPGGEGPHAFTWKDKPHRLVYDLVFMVQELREHNKKLEIAAQAAMKKADDHRRLYEELVRKRS